MQHSSDKILLNKSSVSQQYINFSTGLHFIQSEYIEHVDYRKVRINKPASYSSFSPTLCSQAEVHMSSNSTKSHNRQKSLFSKVISRCQSIKKPQRQKQTTAGKGWMLFWFWSSCFCCCYFVYIKAKIHTESSKHIYSQINRHTEYFPCPWGTRQSSHNSSPPQNALEVKKEQQKTTHITNNIDLNNLNASIHFVLKFESWSITNSSHSENMNWKMFFKGQRQTSSALVSASQPGLKTW